MRSGALLVVALSAGCHAPAPPPPSVVAPSVSAAAPLPIPNTAPMAAAPLTPLPCSPGAPVDAAAIYHPLTGSFSGPGADEMIAEITCDPAGHDLGGRALLRRRAGVWTVARFFPRTDSHSSVGECQVLRTSEGRELAVCQVSRASYGDLFWSVVVLDYARADGEELFSLVSIHDTTGTACTGVTELVVGSLSGVTLVDVNEDGNRDVRVRLRAAKVRVPRQPPCSSPGEITMGPTPPNLPQPALQTIDFLARGATLSPTPAGARILASIAALNGP